MRFAQRDPPNRDLAAYVSRSVSSAPYPFRARILLRAPLETVAERVSPALGRLEAIDAGACELETGASSLDWLVAWISLLGVDFEVREPPQLVEQSLMNTTLSDGASPLPVLPARR